MSILLNKATLVRRMILCRLWRDICTIWELDIWRDICTIWRYICHVYVLYDEIYVLCRLCTIYIHIYIYIYESSCPITRWRYCKTPSMIWAPGLICVCVCVYVYVYIYIYIYIHIYIERENTISHYTYMYRLLCKGSHRSFQLMPAPALAWPLII